MKTVLRTILAFFLGIFVLFSAAPLQMIVMQRCDAPPSWMLSSSQHGVMFVVSMILILIFSRGKWLDWGFRSANGRSYVFVTGWGFLLGILMSLIMMLLPESDGMPGGDMSFLQQVVFIWFVASIAEEFLCRGFLYGFLQSRSGIGFRLFGAHLSLPTIFAALFFSFMHLPLLAMGVNPPNVLVILVFTFLLGMFAGVSREKSGSLLPAIVMHMCGNVGGSLVALLG